MAAISRVSMPDQVAEFLRAGISAARWLQEMPSEAELCRELQISRVTLRKSLEQLMREGWLAAGGRGRHHRICKQGRARTKVAGRIVRVLSPFSLASVGSIQHVMLDTVAERLGSAKCHLAYEHRPALFTHRSTDELQRLAALPETGAWILYFSTPLMQRWFADHKVPCLVMGRLHEGIELPCILPDLGPVGRHAAGLFHQRGHRELVYLMAEFTGLNDQICAENFTQEGRRLGSRVQIITHSRKPAELSYTLGLLLAARPRPTAFFSACPEHCLTVLSYLREAGLRVPADSSIISGWDDEFLHFTIPRFACYRIDSIKVGRKLTAMLLDLIRLGPGKPQMVVELPTFFPGETLGPGPLSSKTSYV